MAAVLDAFHARQMQKLHEKAAAVTVENSPEMDPDGAEVFA